MDTRGLKMIGISLLTILVLFMVFFAVSYWKYRSVQRENPSVTVTQDPVFLPVGDGTQVLNASFRVPWNNEPLDVLFLWGDGVIPVSEPQFLFDGYGWGANHWTVRVAVKSGADCLASAGMMQVEFIGKSFVFKLPPLHTLTKGEMQIEKDAERSEYLLALIMWIGGFLIVLLVLMTIRDFFRKRIA